METNLQEFDALSRFWRANLNIVLVEPEIPGNTGSIGRTCVALGATLTLVEPLGFSLEEKQLRRAGLDYWPHLQWGRLPSAESLWVGMDTLEVWPRSYLVTTKGRQFLGQCPFVPGAILIFGKETKGLSAEVLAKKADRTVRLPMRPESRSLNLAVSVGAVAYTAMAQLNWPGLQLSASGTK
jgi:tRNA (cytidine/uridine-2'-O-)-methyltransferase